MLSDEKEKIIAWLKNNDPDCDDENSIKTLIEHWNNSFEFRNKNSFSTKTFADIIIEYPFLKKQYSFVLVSFHSKLNSTTVGNV